MAAMSDPDPDLDLAIAVAVNRYRERVAGLQAEIARARETLTADILAAVDGGAPHALPTPSPGDGVSAAGVSGPTPPGGDDLASEHRSWVSEGGPSRTVAILPDAATVPIGPGTLPPPPAESLLSRVLIAEAEADAPIARAIAGKPARPSRAGQDVAPARAVAVPPRPMKRPGPGGAHALLTAEDERAALAALLACEHIAVVADRYGITQQQLRSLRSNRQHKDRARGARACLRCGKRFVPRDYKQEWFCAAHRPQHEPLTGPRRHVTAGGAA
jgi:hypothetical protein